VKLFSNSNLCDHNPPTSQTDGHTTCDRKTALCTVVHLEVIIYNCTIQFSSSGKYSKHETILCPNRGDHIAHFLITCNFIHQIKHKFMNTYR